jgi:uncharacterized protein YceK
MKKLLLALCVGVLLGGCATTRNFEQPDARFLQSEIERGDRVLVVAKNGKTYRFAVTTVTADTLYGEGNRKRYKVAFAAIDSIEVERDHPVAATSGVLGAVLTVGLVAVVVAALENMSDQNWDFCGGN